MILECPHRSFQRMTISKLKIMGYVLFLTTCSSPHPQLKKIQVNSFSHAEALECLRKS